MRALLTFAFVAAVAIVFLVHEAIYFRRLRRTQVIVCRCGHSHFAHSGGSCVECDCFLWEPTVRLVTCEDLVNQAARKGR